MQVLERLDELYAIGGGPGANRPHPGPGEDEAFELAAGWMTEAGLAVESDAAGNLLGRSGEHPDVWVGSHLDTVPQGGRFDGALGVVAAIEAVGRAGAGTAVAFRGEEVGCVGSRAVCARSGPLPAVFLELHVEQGPVLEREGAPLGVVTGIVGYARGELVLEGRAGHAGTTPMRGRDDALVAAAEADPPDPGRRFGARGRGGDGRPGRGGARRRQRDPGARSPVGRCPGAGRGDARPARRRDRRRARSAHRAGGDEPTDRAALAEELAARGLPVVELASGAGHDAGILAAAGVESGMLFVRSLNGGVSHSPDELSSDEDVSLAVDVLSAALVRLAEGEASRAPTTP